MRIGTKLAGVFAAMLLGTLSVLAADLSGKWTTAFDTQIGQQKYTFTFTPDGDKLTGKAHWERMGTQGDVVLQDCKLVGDRLTFVETLDFDGMAIRIDYTGTLKGDEIAFSRKVGDLATEEFVAKRAAQ